MIAGLVSPRLAIVARVDAPPPRSPPQIQMTSMMHGWRATQPLPPRGLGPLANHLMLAGPKRSTTMMTLTSTLTACSEISTMLSVLQKWKAHECQSSSS